MTGWLHEPLAQVHRPRALTDASFAFIQQSRQHLESSRSHPLQSQLLLDEDEQASGLAHAEINITQRDREIDQIAKSIAELAELFQDLSALVIDQGTMLDRIDFNIEHMGEDMNAAVRELSGATRLVLPIWRAPYKRRTVDCCL